MAHKHTYTDHLAVTFALLAFAFLFQVVVFYEQPTLYAESPVEQSYCGDGVLDSNEQCEDGNNENGDGCNQSCMVETIDETMNEDVL